MRRGLTLLELLISVAGIIMITGALSFSYSVALQWQQRLPGTGLEQERLERFEDRIRTIVEGAYITADANDALTYFEGTSASGDTIQPDTLTFTSLTVPPDGAFLAPQDSSFEDMNDEYGPQTGVAEVSISRLPVGEQAPPGEGLYLRVQRPSDGDPTQGGWESLITAEVEDVHWEFYNGSEWVSEWVPDTLGRRLPSAVRMFYRILGEDTERSLTIRLRHSDATLENPVLPQTEGDDA